MCSNNVKPFTVFVEGNIGSGKTTFLEHFRQFEDITLLTEPVEEWRNLKGWNLLVSYYYHFFNVFLLNLEHTGLDFTPIPNLLCEAPHSFVKTS